jgi:hypothetical protein
MKGVACGSLHFCRVEANRARSMRIVEPALAKKALSDLQQVEKPPKSLCASRQDMAF